MFGIVVAGLLLDREKEKDAKGMSRECEREQESLAELVNSFFLPPAPPPPSQLDILELTHAKYHLLIVFSGKGFKCLVSQLSYYYA